MQNNELIIKIDFEDRAGLGYEIFAVCEENNIDKIGMEVIPEQGMYIRLRVNPGHTKKFIDDLKKIKGVIDISYPEYMPYEEREHKLGAILNAVSDGIVAINKNGILTHINKVACQIFNCTQDEVLGIDAAKLLGENAPILKMLTTGKPYRLLERKIVRNNKTIRFLTSGVPVMNEKGQIIGAVATINDFKHVEEIISKVELRSKLTSFDDIVFISTKMKQIVETAKIVAKGNSTILLRGESGTGKELFARAIHMESSRANKPFIAVNCAALPDTLLESELFGYEEGAFTGALKGGKKGLFEQADKGTIFLDEIGEISQSVQVRLLRVLQEGTLRRVGGTKEIEVDVRIIAATHRDLENMMKNGGFRDDLYYRLNVIPLRIPPLRERKEDIPLIAYHLLRKISAKLGKEDLVLSKESLELLKAQAWPGNVRELENVLERVVNVVSDEEIQPKHFYEWTDLDLPEINIPEKEEEFLVRIPIKGELPSLKEIVQEAEKQVINKVLKNYRSSRKAGAVLGVSNTTILNKIHAYNIEHHE